MGLGQACDRKAGMAARQLIISAGSLCRTLCQGIYRLRSIYILLPCDAAMWVGNIAANKYRLRRWRYKIRIFQWRKSEALPSAFFIPWQYPSALQIPSRLQNALVSFPPIRIPFYAPISASPEMPSCATLSLTLFGPSLPWPFPPLRGRGLASKADGGVLLNSFLYETSQHLYIHAPV